MSEAPTGAVQAPTGEGVSVVSVGMEAKAGSEGPRLRGREPMTHVPHTDEEQRKVCERLREPSQEAVEQLRATIQLAKDRFSDIRQDWSDPREDIRSGQEALDQALVLVDSALCALEQRTRLETLERAAEIIRNADVCRCDDPEVHGHWPLCPSIHVSAYEKLIQAEIASLQPEAPKAEEPKHVCGLTGYNGMLDPPCPGCAALFERECADCRASSEWDEPCPKHAAPQPGPEEGR